MTTETAPELAGQYRGALARGQDHRVDLCREFLEEIISAALAEAAALDPQAPSPVVDWDAILGAAELGRTPEGAVGAVVLAATDTASEIVRTARASTTRTELAPVPPSHARTAPSLAPIEVPLTIIPSRPPSLDVPPAVEPLSQSQSAVEFLYGADPQRSWDWGQSRAPRRAQPAPVHRTKTKRGRRLKLAIAVSTWVRNIGAIVIVFAAWQLWGTGLAQHQSQHELASQFQATEQHAVATAPSHHHRTG